MSGLPGWLTHLDVVSVSPSNTGLAHSQLTEIEVKVRQTERDN